MLTEPQKKKTEAIPHKKMKMEKEKARELPLSLIEYEILPRLPAKSAGRCRCVCKRWKSFLSTPTFVRMHLNHVTINDYKLLVSDNDGYFRRLDAGSTTIPSPSNPDPYPPGADIILASLDGLVCVFSRECIHELVVWNPSTGDYKKLPLNPHTCCLEVEVFSFYIDHSSNDYKLLHLIDGGREGAYIYSRSLDSWREIDSSLFHGSSRGCTWSSATLCGQCLYFTVEDFDFESDCFITWIICFDVETETFRKIQFPFVPKGTHEYSGGLVVLNGCLHLCISYQTKWQYCKQWNHGQLWRMDGDVGDADGWVKVAAFRDTLPQITRQPICTASTGNWLAVLDQEKNSFENMNMEDLATHYPYFSSPTWKYRSRHMIYVESLVSPNP